MSAPAQRCPAGTRVLERYDCMVLLEVAHTLRALLGWQLVVACRSGDGWSATYERP